MKQLPNILTLINLLFGCVAILYVLQPGLVPLYTNSGMLLTADIDNNGTQFLSIPEQMFMASLFIGLAAVVDFFDGFVARWLKASSPLGAQLDSLSDVVSFGVAPSLIVYQFLKLSFAQQEDGLNTNVLWLVPAFFIAGAGAYRLARFNLDTEHKNYFTGLPIPANGLLIASFPLIYWTNNFPVVTEVLINPWFWYAIILLLTYLMVSKMPMLAMKFSGIGLKKILPFVIILVIAIAAAFLNKWIAIALSLLLPTYSLISPEQVQKKLFPFFLMAGVSIIACLFIDWLAVPLSFIIYVLLSLLHKKPS